MNVCGAAVGAGGADSPWFRFSAQGAAHPSGARGFKAGLLLLVAGLLGAAAWGQSPLTGATNDDFAKATAIYGGWGSIQGCNTNATAEPGEPSHANIPPQYSIWYKWTAPLDGEVTMDTFGSYCASETYSFARVTNVFTKTEGTNTVTVTNVSFVGVTNEYDGPLDTVLAVYTGPDLEHLAQVAANDDISALLLQKDQYMDPGVYDLPFGGPSDLRFNALSNTVYYIAIDSKGSSFTNGIGDAFNAGGNQSTAPNGFPQLNWAYHSSGVFRFASEEFNWTSTEGPIPMYYASPAEDIPFWDVNYKTYYTYFPTGLVVSVTRVGGSSGRVLVDYTTVDGTGEAANDWYSHVGSGATAPKPAFADFDYAPVSGTLVFDDFEMSKDIVIPILGGEFYALGEMSGPVGFDFSVQLSNPRLDPAESPDVSPPRLDLSWSNATVRVLNAAVVMDYTTNRDVFNFSQVHYRFPVDVGTYYNSTNILITVFRTAVQLEQGGDAATIHYRINQPYLDDAAGEGWDNFFPLEPGCDYATPTPATMNSINGTNSDFVLDDGDLTFAATQPWAVISLAITNDGLTKFARTFKVSLWRDAESPMTGEVPCGTINECYVTILFNDLAGPAGSVDETNNPDLNTEIALPFVPFSDPADMFTPGADGQVLGMAVFPNLAVYTTQQGTNTVTVTNALDKTVIVGQFGSYNSYVRNGIARVNSNGSLDQTFLAPPLQGDGGSGFVSCIGVTTNNQLLVGGGFTAFNGATCPGIALLNDDGSTDTTDFQPGTGPNAPVRAVLVMPNGQFLIAGDFTSYNSTPASHIARLNPNGSLDTSFVSPALAGNTINALALYNNQVYIGGGFSVTAASGTSLANLARLNSDGSLDQNYAGVLGVGPDGIVHALAVDLLGNLLVGGEFLSLERVSCTRIARLTPAGLVDTTFNTGTGADATIFTLLPQYDGTLYVGGAFTTFNGTHRLGVARLFNDGTVDTAFLDTAYNQFAGLHRERYSDPPGTVFTMGVQSDGKVLIGGAFTQVGGGQNNPVLRIDSSDGFGPYNQNVDTQPKTRTGLRNRLNFARLMGGSTPGPGNLSLSFSGSGYSVLKSEPSTTITLMRTNGSLGFLSANLSVPSSTAQSGVDYSYSAPPPAFLNAWRLYQYIPAVPPYAQTRRFTDGIFGYSPTPTDIYGSVFLEYTPDVVNIGVLDNSTPGNRSASIQLANPSCADVFYLGGQNIPVSGALAVSTAAFTIVDDNHNPGVFTFTTTNYTINENQGQALISVVRTNGSYGDQQISYGTTTNGNAVTNRDYVATNGVLNFNAGVTSNVFAVPIINNTNIQPQDRIVGLYLQAKNGLTLGASNASLLIIDDNYPVGYVNFTQGSYATNESAGALVLTLNRTGGTKGVISVTCSTTNNGTAVPGLNYLNVTTNFTWSSGDSSPRYCVVPLLDNGLVGLNTTFEALLSNPVAYGTNAETMLAGSRTTAKVTIVNDNQYGNLEFSEPTYYVNEDGGYATITVVRTGGAAQHLTVNFFTTDGTATSVGPQSFRNYAATNGTLNFAPGQIASSFTVPVNDVGENTNLFFTVGLSNATPQAAVLGFPTVAVVSIISAETTSIPPGEPDPQFPATPGFNGDVLSVGLQTNGQVLAGGNFTVADGAGVGHVARLNPDSTLDSTFLNGMPGANAAVNSVLVQSDGSIVIGGAFTTFNGADFNHIVRVLTDGSLDSTFLPGAGADDSVFALAEVFPVASTNRFLLVGGSFAHMNGAPAAGLARLNEQGEVDTTFAPVFNAGSTIYAVASYPTNVPHAGQILVGGDFNAVNGVGYNGIVRLNPDGTPDLTFIPGTGATNAVRAIAIQLDGNILVGGSFTNFNGLSLNHVARLNPDGSLDPDFTSGIGPGTDDTVDGIALQPDTRILLVGAFTHANGVNRGGITRLLPDGTLDPSINFGYGANGPVNSLALEPNAEIVIGGGFTTFDQQPRFDIARLFGGAISGSVGGAGALTFAAPVFDADENATNATVTVRRTGGTAGTVAIDFATSNGTATNGINYSNVSATLVFSNGQTFQSILVPVIDDGQITPNLMVNLTLSNPTGGATLGDEYLGTLLIYNDDSAVSFTSTNYTVPQNPTTGSAEISLIRNGGTRFPASATFYTTTNGTALLGVDYQAVSNTVVFPVGESNVVATVPILNDPGMLNNAVVDLGLTNASGTYLFNPSTAYLTIMSTNASPGQLYFQSTNYIVPGTNGAVAAVSVLRTNGHTGAISVGFDTSSPLNSGGAIPNVNYAPTNGTLAFADGEKSKTIFVPIYQDSAPHGPLTFYLSLTNPSPGTAILTPREVSVTILDTVQGVGFPVGTYVTNETAQAVVLQVARLLPDGVTTVDYSSSDGSAVAGINYTASKGSLTFIQGETLKSLSIPVMDDPRITGTLSFDVNLSNPSGGAVLYPVASALVELLDQNTGFSFTNPTFGVLKNGTNVQVTVVRTNANTGVASVTYSTRDLTALANVDYVPTSGLLIFSNGIVDQSFPVSIINNRTLEGNRTFEVVLTTNSTSLGNPQLVAPSTATVTITDDITGLSFSSPAYSIDADGGQATIAVVRTGYTNCIAVVQYATASPGTNTYSAIPNVNYIPTNGTLIFTNGATSLTFAVPVIDDHRADGAHTVQLVLSSPNVVNSPLGFAVLGNPNAATLTIVQAQGSDLLAAGAALTFTRSFTNPATLSPGAGGGAGYPSVIAVSNLYSEVENVAVRFPNVTLPAADSLGALLAGPSGAATVLMGNAGGASALSGASLGFNALATNTLPSTGPLTNGTYIPAAYPPAPNFPSAPVPASGASLASFIDSSPNGNWSLYTVDSAAPSSGHLSGGWALDLTCLETNAARVILPSETVTMLFSFRNAGSNIDNLVATLLPTNGVSNPSGPQSYGLLSSNGPSASRLFTFTAAGTNGEIISPTFQVANGATALTNLSFSFVLGTSTTTYSNNTPIIIPDHGPASIYPSTINVAGFNSIVSKVTVTLTNLAHTWPADIDILLVSPEGQVTYLMSKCGGSFAITNTTVTLDSTVSDPLPHSAQITNGTYAPTCYAFAAPPFPLPAPASTPSSPYYTNLAIFDGINPNNTWSLYVFDDTPQNSGIISNGWLLNLVTANPVQQVADVGLSMSALASTVILTSNLTFTVGATNYGPSIADNVAVTDILPAGAAFVSSSPVGVLSTNSAGSTVLTWGVGNMLKGAYTNMTLTVQPGVVGTATNAVFVSAATADLNSGDASVFVTSQVVSPTVQLVMNLVSLPNSVALGGTYTLAATVTNLGPASAPGLAIVLYLDPTVDFVSAEPPGWSLDAVDNIITFTNLPVLGSNQFVSVSAVVKPTIQAEDLTYATTFPGATIVDINKSLADGSVKTVVVSPLVLQVLTPTPDTLLLAWPAGQGTFNVQVATNLTPPVTWTTVTNPAPTLVGGQYIFTAPIGTGNQFFRLNLATP